MKMLKKLSTLILGAALVCALVLTPEIKSRADGPVTYYITCEGGEWYSSSNVVDYWVTGTGYATTNIKDGDHLVVNGNNCSSGLLMVKVDKKLGDYAVTGGAMAHVEAPYVNRAYVAGKGSTLIVTANTVENVEIYPAQVIQVNGNVVNFLAHYDYNTGESPVFAVTGTVTAANVAYGGKIENSHKTIYGIAAGLFKSNNEGFVTLSDGQYFTSPTEPPKAGTADQTGTANKAADSSKKQLDKVPQTGLEVSQETVIFAVLALIFASAAVMVGFASKNRN